jgi:uncharacterized protein
MKSLAVIGSGIAGLGSAYLLSNRFRVTVYEENNYAGGHSNTVQVDEDGCSVPIDTGFMVFNHVTYPNLTKLFQQLGAPTKPAPMSFSSQHLPEGIEFSGTSLNHLFAQRRNLLSPRFWRLLASINRFNSEAPAAMDDPAYADCSLGEFLERRGYGKDLARIYLGPMSAAVWSAAPERILEFPATTLMRFFHNHGFLGLHCQHQWYTVDGGSREYVQRITKPLRERIQLNRGARQIMRPAEGGVVVRSVDGALERYDHAILACHADQALSLLAEPTPLEERLLRPFNYQNNVAALHTDPAGMPQRKLCWSSWNYRIAANPDGSERATTVYWMNSLQGVSPRKNYFVSINPGPEINPDKVLKTISYRHPQFDLPAITAQRELPQINRQSPGQPVFFAGSYFGYGFHEDGFSAGIEAAKALAGDSVWS